MTGSGAAAVRRSLFTEDVQKPGCTRRLNLRNIGCLPAECHLHIDDPRLVVQTPDLAIPPGAAVRVEVSFDSRRVAGPAAGGPGARATASGGRFPGLACLAPR